MNKPNPDTTRTILILISMMSAVAGLTLPAFALPSSRRDQSSSRWAAGPQSGIESPIEPAAILAAARVIYINSRTGFVKSEVIENELLKRPEFQRTGMVITRDPRDADLVMEVRRSNFTTEYPYVVVDQRTRLIVASGKVNSLFGTAAAKIAKGFIKQLQEARTPAAANKE